MRLQSGNEQFHIFDTRIVFPKANFGRALLTVLNVSCVDTDFKIVNHLKNYL